MQSYKRICSILNDEPEYWLAYLQGQQTANLPHLNNERDKWIGSFRQTIKFLIKLFLNIRIENINKSDSANRDFVFYIGSNNQLAALESTIISLINEGKSIVLIVESNINTDALSGDNVLIIERSLNLFDIFKVLILVAARYRQLFKSVDRNVLRFHLSSFLESYSSIVLAIKTFDLFNPKVFISANDHNVINRSFFVCARRANIKTVYLQHASVSKYFPALEVDYAFLDGQFALDIYRECRNNTNTENKAKTTVILSGQKKQLSSALSRNILNNERTIGIAVNKLDCPLEISTLVDKIISLKYNVILRFHPSQPADHLQYYERRYNEHFNVKFSYAKFDSISEFFKNIAVLIAGNSSIHLEAVLAGIYSIYYDSNSSIYDDYYGYVKNRISIKAKSVTDVLHVISEIGRALVVDPISVRYYSATFGTAWENKEGKLVVKILNSLLEQKLESEFKKFVTIY